MMSSRNTSPVLDRVLRAGLVTPALALTILAGAAFAQQGAMGGRVYEVIVESVDDEANQQERRERRADSPARSRGGARVAAVARAQDAENARVVVEINRVVDGQEISVRRVNEDPITVKIDGKVITKDHYSLRGSVLVVTHPKTGEVSEIRMPQMGGLAPGVARVDAPRWIGRAQDLDPIAVVSPVPGVAQAANEPRVMLGVVMAEPDAVLLEHLALDASKAVVLERVIGGLPADKAGLQVKDIIVGFGDNAEPRSADDIRKVLAKAEPGKVVKLKVIRKGEPLKLDLKLEAFDGAALGRVTAPEPAGAGFQHRGDAPFPQQWREFQGNHWAQFDRDHAEHRSHMERAHKAMEEAAELLARMEFEVDEHAEHAHRQASEAIHQAIEAMQQGDMAGMEIEEIRRFQQEAVERLRRDLADNQNVQRFWAERGPDGEGFALTFPGEARDASNEWVERMEVLESRLSELERNVERAMERLEDRTEVMVERLIERLERVIERQEDEAHGRRGR